MALPKTPIFYKLIERAIASFGERHHITARQHFAQLLGYRGENAGIMLSTALNYTTYNPASPKPLNIDHLYVLLNELGEDRNIILDGLASEFDMMLIPREHALTTTLDINYLADDAIMESADVFRVVKVAIADKIITKEEKESILKEIDEAQRANALLRDRVAGFVVEEE